MRACPFDARASLIVLAAQLQALQTLIKSIEKRLLVQHRANEASKRLESIPGIGIIGASAIAATVTDPKAFRSGRDFAAWIGLVPRQDSTGGKQKLGPISKQGRPLPAAYSYARGGGPPPFRAAAGQAEPAEISLAGAAPGTATVQGRCHCACEQDGPHRVGFVGQRRHLPDTRARGGVKRGNGRMRLRRCVHELQG
jgi:Transposase IS116/IS110/IS902 family